jgi:hypothetical protein
MIFLAVVSHEEHVRDDSVCQHVPSTSRPPFDPKITMNHGGRIAKVRVKEDFRRTAEDRLGHPYPHIDHRCASLALDHSGMA